MNSVFVLIVVAALSFIAFYVLSTGKSTATPAKTADQPKPDHRHAAAAEDSDAEQVANEEAEEEWSHLPRLQRLKKQKEAEKRRRRAEAAAAEEARRERAKQREDLEVETATKEAESAAKEAAALEELRAEKRRQDDDEYAKWVGEMDVEERGEMGEAVRQRHETLTRYLVARASAVSQCHPTDNNNNNKNDGNNDATPMTEGERVKSVMVLQDAARETGVTVPEMVATIQQLLKDGRVTGVFDDRGKFVFVSEEHFRLVAKFIKLRGRVSLVEVARECNKIIVGS